MFSLYSTFSLFLHFLSDLSVLYVRELENRKVTEREGEGIDNVNTPLQLYNVT